MSHDEKTPSFDLEAAIQALYDGKPLNGKDGVLTPLIKQPTEAAMEAERDAYLANSPDQNRKNGHTTKTMNTGYTAPPGTQDRHRFDTNLLYR